MSENYTRRPVELLKISALFAGLADEDLERLAHHCEIRDYHENALILDEKPVGGCVYIIDTGDVAISRKENDQETILARFIGDECFGELDLFGSSGGAVTIRAESSSRLLLFPANGMGAGEIFRSNPAIGSLVIKNLLSMVAKRIRSTNNLISQRSPWVQELRKLVFVDKLTGLYNHTWLTEELEKELAGKRSGTAVLIIKPDNFKIINDTYGHDAGDKTLSLFAETVRQASEHVGSAARHGGDVFAVVYKNSNTREARSLAKSILKAIRNIDMETEINAKNIILTASIGIMDRKPGNKTPILEIVQTAFDRMLLARGAGGDRICDTGSYDG